MVQRMLRLLLPLASAFFILPPAHGWSQDDELPTSGTDGPIYSLSAFGYWVEGEDFFILPIATADFGTLHLEARYNYEDFKTGSLFAGWNLAFGSTVEVNLTPIGGVAFGRTTGLIPGLEAEVLYDILGFSLEGEYIFDLEDSAANFLYVWSELYASPTEWLFGGLAVQRMMVVQEDAEVSRGLMVGGTWENISATFYLFEPGSSESFSLLGIEWIP